MKPTNEQIIEEARRRAKEQNWREHNGGPQPVREDVWVEIECDLFAYSKSGVQEAGLVEWCGVKRWRVLNQAEIDAALERGIRLGLEAAKRHADACLAFQSGPFISIPPLDPATIAREATLDTLTAEAQASDMGYDRHDTKRLPAALIGQPGQDQ